MWQQARAHRILYLRNTRQQILLRGFHSASIVSEATARSGFLPHLYSLLQSPCLRLLPIAQYPATIPMRKPSFKLDVQRSPTTSSGTASGPSRPRQTPHRHTLPGRSRTDVQESNHRHGRVDLRMVLKYIESGG